MRVHVLTIQPLAHEQGSHARRTRAQGWSDRIPTLINTKGIQSRVRKEELTAKNLAAVKNGGARSARVVLLASSTIALQQEQR